MIAIAVVMTFLWTVPLWNESKLLVASKEELQNTLQRFQFLQKKFDDLRNQYSSISKENLASLDEILPSSPGAAVLLVNLEKISKDSGVSLKNINVADAKTSGPSAGQVIDAPYETLPFDISFVSSYEVFRTFLRNLEESRRLLDISDIAFSSGKNNSYQFSIKAATYWRPK